MGFCLVGYHLWTAGFGQFPPLIQRSMHLALGLGIAYLQFSRIDRGEGLLKTLARVLNIGVALITICACIYIVIVEERLSNSFSIIAKPEEMILGVFLSFAILEGARRTTGPFLPLLAIALISYTLFGQFIPGRWGHPGFSGTYVLEYLYLGTEGIWGTVTGLSANLISIFIIFGAFLLATGAGESFMSLAMVAAGRFPGGAAKVATVASALFGMLNGAAVANVATTGNFTIPAMKRLGYRPAFAGAVEATASSGGQITPPIMGAGAFVMAELLSTSYLNVVEAAIIPAFLFFACIWMSIGVEARREGMKTFSSEEIPKLRDVLRWRKVGPLVLTITVMMVSMFAGNTPALAAFYGICTNVVLFMIAGPFTRAGLQEKLAKLSAGVRLASTGIVTIIALLVSAQIALSLIGLSGIGIKLSEQIITVGAGGGMLLSLVLALIVALVLGMGMPTTAAYLLAAAVTVPALIELNVAPLAAHFFVFYGALLSALTPPVCTAVFTAAVIAETHWWPIALTSMRLAVMKYVLPFYFIYRPEILMNGSAEDIIWVVVAGLLASWLFAISIGGFYINRLPGFVRIVALGVGIGMISGELALDVAGVVVVVAIGVWDRMRVVPAE
ncbi:MAG: TRAP transporter fused permease subunit, partial [Rhodospirillales bacterium]